MSKAACGPFDPGAKGATFTPFCPRAESVVFGPLVAEGLFLSLQRPTGAFARRLSAGWRWAIALAFCAAVPIGAAPSYALLGEAAPDFALRAIAGNNVRLSEHRGEVVVLSFWGSRCAPCRAELAALDRSFATYHSAGLQIFGINVDDDPSRALEFAHAQKLAFALLLDPGKAVSRGYQVDSLPMTVLIDRNGKVRHVIRDYSAKAQDLYLQQLRALLNE